MDGAIQGVLPSLVVAGSGEPGDPFSLSLDDAWAGLVADGYPYGPIPCTSGTRPATPLEGMHIYETDTDLVYYWSGAAWKIYGAQVATGTYTPTLANAAVGTGGSASNTADYVFVGGANSGDEGIMFIQGSIVLGTSGESMGTGPTATLPSGFTQNVPVATGLYRQGGCSMSAGASGNVQGFVQYSSTTAVAIVVADTASTYLGNSTITSTIPGTWVAGDLIRWWYTANVSRT